MARIGRRTVIKYATAGAATLLARGSAASTRTIDEAGFVRIGGIDQWIAIQGKDARNPGILYLHGGPGEAQSPFLQQFLPWEHDYIVANWDQRGAGKTFGRNGPTTPGMTLDRLTDDVIEVAQHVCGRLSRRKLILVGQSWGSLLGVHALKRRPELFHAFVGTGQFVSFAATIADRVRWARRQAAAAGDLETLTALDAAAALSPDRRGHAQASASRKWVMSDPDRKYEALVREFTGVAPYPDKGEVADWLAGGSFSGAKFISVIAQADLRELGLDMPIPFFVIQGREDRLLAADTAQAYVDEIRAPAKNFLLIDGGHFACFTHAEEFNAALNKQVRPFAI
jgi:pimeloyl-ACP methyl ester carboxylesterase